MKVQSLYQQLLDTWSEHFQPASELASEKGSNRPPALLILRFRTFLKSPETSYPIDAGSTVMCLSHGQVLADSLKPKLVHEAGRCLGRHSSVTRPIFLNDRSSDGRKYYACKKRTIGRGERCCTFFLGWRRHCSSGVRKCKSSKTPVQTSVKIRLFFLNPKRVNDSQRSITAARGCESCMVVLNFQDKTHVRVGDWGTVDLTFSTKGKRRSYAPLRNVPSAVS